MYTLKSKKFIFLGLFIFLSFFMSWWGGYVSRYFKEPWYSELIKPSFNPPDWIFAPVWMTLYLLMGFAIWLIKLYQPINKISTLLMFPYLAWLGFAFSLNFAIFVLN